VRLFHDLTQILRLCLPGAFDPKTASAGVLALLALAADLPDFTALPAQLNRLPLSRRLAMASARFCQGARAATRINPLDLRTKIVRQLLYVSRKEWWCPATCLRG
jgi:hypothetical protein